MKTNKTWIVGLPLAAAAAFLAVSQAQPARASEFHGSTGPVLSIEGQRVPLDDPMQDVANAVAKAANDELARQSRTPSKMTAGSRATQKAASRIYN